MLKWKRYKTSRYVQSKHNVKEDLTINQELELGYLAFHPSHIQPSWRKKSLIGSFKLCTLKHPN